MNSNDPPPLRIATRHSPLAMWQAKYVAARLAGGGIGSELVPLVSSGDIDMRPMEIALPGEVREVGVFTKSIQQALVDNVADIAVHSMKDLPTDHDSRFALLAVPRRADVRDALVSPQKYTIATLPPGAVVGTGSKRRAAQLLAHRDDLQILPIRGNVQTRLAKLQNGDYAAIVLAEAGIERLGMHDLPRTLLSIDDMLPAPGQAALAIEVRAADRDSLQSAAQQLDDFSSHAAVLAERTMLSLLDGGCLAPIAAWASFGDGGMMTLRALVMSPDGRQRIEHAAGAVVNDHAAAIALGRQVAENLQAQNAAEILFLGREK